jgi:hypothetical protein
MEALEDVDLKVPHYFFSVDTGKAHMTRMSRALTVAVDVHSVTYQVNTDT